MRANSQLTIYIQKGKSVKLEQKFKDYHRINYQCTFDYLGFIRPLPDNRNGHRNKRTAAAEQALNFQLTSQVTLKISSIQSVPEQWVPFYQKNNKNLGVCICLYFSGRVVLFFCMSASCEYLSKSQKLMCLDLDTDHLVTILCCEVMVHAKCASSTCTIRVKIILELTTYIIYIRLNFQFIVLSHALQTRVYNII